MKIVISGGSGQIGQSLARAFVPLSMEVVMLSRTNPAGMQGRHVPWDARMLGDWTRELVGADVLINLVGFSVNCRYNSENRRRILESRVQSTKVLREAFARVDNPPAL